MTPIPSQGLCPLRIHCVGFDPHYAFGKMIFDLISLKGWI